MEKMGEDLMFANIYNGRKVFVTGHTGFKGSWLVSWLLDLGAEVAGYALEAPSNPSNFDVLGLKNRIRHFNGDVRDRTALSIALNDFKPEIVFHLAAQALVRKSYADPVTTFETNAIGTLNLLESVRNIGSVQAVVMITSDKCYRNVEWIWGYRENDMLGGEDPYSASKACAEVVSYSYIHSFYKGRDGAAAIATARAGNVIGGGDWAADRIVPDSIRAWSEGRPVVMRNPTSTRPWQHVLEPLSGYLALGGYLWRRDPQVLWQSYNFGPDASVNQTVQVLIQKLAEGWDGVRWEIDPQGLLGRPEARLLKLCCDKALVDLLWRPVMSFDETVSFTREWYKHYYKEGPAELTRITSEQIREYTAKASLRGLPWAS
jgi:CDP-glucose 4,6-dehydratase